MRFSTLINLKIRSRFDCIKVESSAICQAILDLNLNKVKVEIPLHKNRDSSNVWQFQAILDLILI